MDINFSKGKVTSDFKEAEELENIKSGERLSVIFGKIQRWYPEIESCITENDLKDALKDLPERYYDADGIKGGIILTPEDENNVASRRGSVVSGVSSRATGPSSIAMGSNCIAIGEGSVSMGMHNQTSNACDFAVGSDNKTMGGHSSAIGISNKTFGRASIAMGEDNQATRLQSVAIGKFNLSSADNSVAIGCGLVADSKYQTVIGRYNIRESDGKYAFIIGNGTSDEASHQSNALTLDWDGNLWTAGDVTATDSDGNNVSLCELKSDFEGLSAITEAEIDKILKF